MPSSETADETDKDSRGRDEMGEDGLTDGS
jgi:hypothetical protein